MKKQTKLRNLINESVLGELPSTQMFKYNKAKGKYEAPGSHSTNEEIEAQLEENEELEETVLTEGKQNQIIADIMDMMAEHNLINRKNVEAVENILAQALDRAGVQ